MAAPTPARAEMIQYTYTGNAFAQGVGTIPFPVSFPGRGSDQGGNVAALVQWRAAPPESRVPHSPGVLGGSRPSQGAPVNYGPPPPEGRLGIKSHAG
jgi:hypothetical protein